MASAELLQVTHSVNDRVRGVDGKVEVICDDGRDVGNEVQTHLLSSTIHALTLGFAERFIVYPRLHRSLLLGTVQAQGYFSHLLRFDERVFQLVVSDGSFLLLYPALQDVRPITCIGNRLAWLLDYMLRDVGTVVSQRLWSPAATADAQRYSTVPLHMPIFFVQGDPTTIGLPLNHAASGQCSAILNARLPAPVGSGHTTFLRIMVSIFSSCSSYEQLCE